MTRATHGRPVLVTGAAGKTGRAAIGALASEGVPVRAFVRRPEQRQAVAALGAGEAVEGDLRSRETVAAAVRGVGAIYHICPNMHPDETAIGRRVVSAALAAGIRQIVYHSVLHPQVESMPHHWNKLRVEALLFESGLDFTILQPAAYMQNVLGQWRSIARRGVYAVPYHLDTRVAMVDLADVAGAACRALTEPGHVGATYELCGPGLLDQHEIAAALGEALGRPVQAVAVPPREWAAKAKATGLDDYRIETLLAMFSYYERFGMAGTPRVLECLLGRSPAGFEEFAARTVAAPPARGSGSA